MIRYSKCLLPVYLQQSDSIGNPLKLLTDKLTGKLVLNGTTNSSIPVLVFLSLLSFSSKIPSLPDLDPKCNICSKSIYVFFL